MNETFKISQSSLSGSKGEKLTNNVFRRLLKLGFEHDGGYNSIARGWVRLSKHPVGSYCQYCQANWHIDNDGIEHISLSFGKIK